MKNVEEKLRSNARFYNSAGSKFKKMKERVHGGLESIDTMKEIDITNYFWQVKKERQICENRIKADPDIDRQN